MIAGVLRRFDELFMGAIERTSLENKEEFRQLFLQPDISQAMVVVFFVALAVGVFIIGDYIPLGLSLTFSATVVLRIGVIAYSAYTIKYLGKIRK